MVFSLSTVPVRSRWVSGVPGVNRLAGRAVVENFHLGLDAHRAVLHQRVGVLAAMHHRAGLDHARQQRLAGRDGFGDFQRVVRRRKIGQRLVQI